PFKLHLPGLLKVLAEHLYSNKQVAVRELIQNAHDSCVRRAVKGGARNYRPRITLSIQAASRTLTISDNGSGLTAEEIETYLATIGRSYTRELRENLSILSADEAAQLIGQFGFGFLSAFLIASEVRLTTRSMQQGSQALSWRSAGDEEYELGPAEREETGTTIELTVKPAAAFVLQQQLLIDAIRQFADFLPIPIYVDSDPAPINLMTPPWEAAEPGQATLDYIERAFQLSDPLCIIPLHDHEVDLGHDAMTIPLQGFLFVPPTSVASVREYGDARVFIRRMFITDAEKDLLPPWARFVRGVIDCPLLQPTASREALHQDDTFESVRQAIEDQLGAALGRIAEEQPAVWRQIVSGHSDVITGWAVRDNAFFERVAPIITFRTSRGQLNLEDYLQQSDGTLYYVTRELGSLQEQLLAEGHDVPVIDASWFAVTPFLEKYASRRRDLRLQRLDGDPARLLRPVSEPAFEPLLAAYRAMGVRAALAAFKPADVPALMIYPKDAEFIIESRQALDEGELADPLAELVGQYLEQRGPEAEELKGTLHLNASCGLIRALAETPPPAPALDAALRLVYQIARVFAGRTLSAQDAALAFRQIGASIEELLP
ncbi:MAG TPA: ATP-binding protein, partial [Herpetosiphonaceae bacterium]